MLKQVKVGAFGTQAQWNLVRSAGVGLSALVRHLPKTIPIVYRFSCFDCSAFVAKNSKKEELGRGTFFEKNQKNDLRPDLAHS